MKIYIKIISILSCLSVVFYFTSCEKTTETKRVTYQITRSISGFNVVYKNADNELVKDTIISNSADDIWVYSFDAFPRDIVYVSGSYKDTNSSILVRVLIDGKVYKQASTTKDTVNYVTVSGTIYD